MNKIILKGRLTGTPELKATTSGISVCDFSLAVNRRFKKDETDFINCQAWRNTAEFICHYFQKGQEILLDGELHIEKYEKNGETKHTTRVVVDSVDFCGSKANNEPKKPEDRKIAEVDEEGFMPVGTAEDLPF